MKYSLGVLLAVCATLLIAPFARAHFKLLEPQSWLVENDIGDPQKLGPCGGTSASAGTASNLINKAVGGQMLHIKVQEMVFHPGHYRIALAVNSRAELPPDPEVTTSDSEKGSSSVSAVIEKIVQVPVLADGLFPHTARQTEPFETDIQLPNISCPKCTLQIVEFMAQHRYNKDGGYFYHHCADLEITADPSKPIETRWAPKQ